MSSGVGTFVPGSATWSLRSHASAGPADVGTFHYGSAALPVVGDWNGDGQDDIGTFNPLNATWSLRYGTSAGAPDAGVFVFGKRGTLPVVGDWNGDGRDDIGVYDPGKAQWSLRYGASAGSANAGSFKFGSKHAYAIAGDWNGDGKDGIGTFDPASATWTLRQTANSGSANAGTFKFGSKNTYPVTGDWNGDSKDGIGVVNPKTATWSVRQTASSGVPDAGTFVFGPTNSIPVTGQWALPAPPTPSANTLATVTLKPLDLKLLGLEVQSSPITVTISAKSGDGKILGNLINSVAHNVSTSTATSALNNVLRQAVDLANSSNLSVDGINPGTFDTAAASTTQVLELFVAPIHTEMLGVQVDTSPVRLSISAHGGNGLVLGNAMTALANLFNPPLPDVFNIDQINQHLSDVLAQLNAQLGSIPAADVPTFQPNSGDAFAFAVPALDMNLLGLNLTTDPVTVDASAQTGDGMLLGNLWATVLNTLQTTPDKRAQLSNTVSRILSRVFGALNASSLIVPPSALSALTPAMQALLSPTLLAPSGSSAPILDLVFSSPGNTPPAAVDLLGLSVASNNLNAQLSATTGDGQVLGNLLYNAASLANPGASASMIALMGQLASGSTAPVAPIIGTFSTTPITNHLYNVTLPPLDLNLLGLEVQTDAITVSLDAQSGDARLLGNVLRGYTTLLNLNSVNAPVNNVLSTVGSLVNSADLSAPQGSISSGVFDTGIVSTTQLLDSTIAPVHMNLAGAVVDSSPIHLKVIAHGGDGLVLGNALTQLSNLFNPPLPDSLDATTINTHLQELLSNLNAQVPGIAPATLPQSLDSSDVLNVKMPGINLDLLGMVLKTDPIIAGIAAHTTAGNLLGNVYTTELNTLGTSVSVLGTIAGNVSSVLAKVVGIFNSSTLTISPSALASLPGAYQTIASPTLINPTTGATGSIFDFGILSSNGSATPTHENLLGVNATTSGAHTIMTAHIGDGLILGNMLYNVSSLLNAGSSSNYLFLLNLLS
jgi:hypothetical protein